MKSDRRRATMGTSVTLPRNVMDALRRAQHVLQVDSNAEDHGALYDLVNGLGEYLSGAIPNETCPVSSQDRPTKHETLIDLKMIVPTYNGKWLLENPSLEECDGPFLPVLVTPADGLRIVLGTHEYDDFDKPGIYIERRHNGWMIFLQPHYAGDTSGFVVFLDDGHSYFAPELDAQEHQTMMVDFEDAVAELDDIKPTGPSCVPTAIVERERREC